MEGSAVHELALRAPGLWLLGFVALGILVVWLIGRDAERARTSAVVLRVLAVLGLVIPGWIVFGWYRDLSAAREWARDLPIRTEPILREFVWNSVALISLGFVVLVGGIYLARRVGAGPGSSPTPEKDERR